MDESILNATGQFDDGVLFDISPPKKQKEPSGLEIQKKSLVKAAKESKEEETPLTEREETKENE